MKERNLWVSLLLAVLFTLPGKPSQAAEPQPPSNGNNNNNQQSEEKPDFPPFEKFTEGAEKLDGFFTLWWNKEEGKLYAEIKPNQFDQPILSPIAIARGLGMSGHPLHQMNQWVLSFRRSGKSLQIVRRNIRYEAPPNSPLKKAVQQNFTDSIIKAVPIRSVKGKTVLVDLADIYFDDFAQLGLGSLDRSRTSWFNVKAFANNVELEVEATFTGGGFYYGYGFGDGGVIDRRGITLVIHYSLVKMPDGGYRPRFADDRVGHFLNATKDYGKEDPDTFFVRRINRWRLEKANPQAELSPPKRQIVWWVENTVPYEFRPYVEEGILEWNKAFEKIGYKNALAVRWQTEQDEFDPENVDYCTFKWLTSGATYAMSGIRANPVTGEIVDGDVVFDASWIKYWKNQYAFLVGSAAAALRPEEEKVLFPLARGEIISPIMATAQGFGLPYPLPEEGQAFATEFNQQGSRLKLVPEQWNPLQLQLRRQMGGNGAFANFCQFSAFQSYQLGLAALLLASDNAHEDNEEKHSDGLSTEFLGQAIKEVVMHEVGHSLGLRHNFKASSIVNNDKLHDPGFTRDHGMVGSVMDYNPMNVAADRDNQGEYYPTTIGPYDYWAIEYAYKDISGDETGGLNEIASRSVKPDLAFATDEDMFLTHDPYVNAWDLGSDPLEFGKTRIQLADKLFEGLDKVVVKDGEAWARLRNAFSILLAQYGDAAALAANFVGGQKVHRDHKSEDAPDPIVPIAGDKQRESLGFLVEHILSDDSFRFPPQLLRRLTSDHWYHWGTSGFYGGSIEYPVYDRILSIQRMILNHCFSPSVLNRIQNHLPLQGREAKPLQIAEIFRSITDGIWATLDVPNPQKEETHHLEFSVIQRNLQRAHLEKLTTIVLGQSQSSFASLYGYVFFGSGASYPADAKSLAKLHLREIKDRMEDVLDRNDVEIEETTRAHLLETRERLTKILEAGLQVSQPW